MAFVLQNNLYSSDSESKISVCDGMNFFTHLPFGHANSCIF